MPFNRQQQGKYRPLVEAAWQTHSRSFGIAPKDRSARDAWYRKILVEATGFDTTSALDQGRDFDALMWRFEEIADEGGSYWQNRAEVGDFRRICYAVFGKYAWQIGDTPITAAYLSGIAKQSLRLPEAPTLRSLSKHSLKVVIRSLAIHRKRVDAKA